jgi:hypothetical protein
MEYKIYGLKVKDTEEVRYIGYTKRTLDKRLYYHFYDCKQGLTYKKCNWIRKHNYDIDIILVEENLTYEQALIREKYWITQYNNLLNMTEGGESNPMNNPDVKKKHSDKMKTIPKEKMFHKGTDNWMTSEEGKAWLSKESKRRWEEGCFKPQQNKYIEYDILYGLYITENKTLKECSIILNTTYRNVVRNLSRLKIKKRKTND